MSGVGLRQIRKNSSTPRSVDIRALLNREVRLWKPATKYSDRNKEIFFSSLAGMQRAGLPVRRVLELIRDQETNETSKVRIGSIVDDLVKGTALSLAMERSGLFSRFEFCTIAVGEETGRLPDVADDLSKLFTDRIKQRRQLISAITYPALLITIAFASTSFLLVYMVPMFEDIFKRFGGRLPWATQMIVDWSHALVANAPLFVVFSIVATFLFSWANKRESFKLFRDRMAVRIPLLGRLYLIVSLARFFRSMSMLLASRLPLTTALEMMKGITVFSPIRLALDTMLNDLYNGMPLHESMSKLVHFNASTIALIRIGEEVNQLENFFETIAIEYTRESEFRIAQMNAMMEPILILVLGLVIGIILITLYLPMFELSSTIGQ